MLPLNVDAFHFHAKFDPNREMNCVYIRLIESILNPLDFKIPNIAQIRERRKKEEKRHKNLKG